MKLIVALALISLIAFAYAGVVGPTPEEYLEVNSDTNSEGGVRDPRTLWFGLHHHRHHGWGHGGYGWGGHIGGHIGWGGYGGWGHGGGYGGWGHRGYGYGGW